MLVILLLGCQVSIIIIFTIVVQSLNCEYVIAQKNIVASNTLSLQLLNHRVEQYEFPIIQYHDYQRILIIKALRLYFLINIMRYQVLSSYGMTIQKNTHSKSMWDSVVETAILAIVLLVRVIHVYTSGDMWHTTLLSLFLINEKRSHK